MSVLGYVNVRVCNIVSVCLFRPRLTRQRTLKKPLIRKRPFDRRQISKLPNVLSQKDLETKIRLKKASEISKMTVESSISLGNSFRTYM